MTISKSEAGNIDGNGGVARGRAQDLCLALLGHAVIDHGFAGPVPSRLFLTALGEFGVTDSAIRAILARLAAQKYLERHVQGRLTGYTLTRSGYDVLSQGRNRILAELPFDHGADEWTLLSFSFPEDRRDSRRQLRTRLEWAGFGRIRDGLWLAPGDVGIDRVVTGAPDLEYLLSAIDVFTARPRTPTNIPALVSRVWDLESIRSEHEIFLSQWETVHGVARDPLVRLTALLADWIHLLRVDPGLPPAHLGPRWPAVRSAATFRRLHAELDVPALARFKEQAMSWGDA